MVSDANGRGAVVRRAVAIADRQTEREAALFDLAMPVGELLIVNRHAQFASLADRDHGAGGEVAIAAAADADADIAMDGARRGEVAGLAIV